MAKRSTERSRKGLPLSEANLAIAQLSKLAVETVCKREGLDRPLDEGIVVTRGDRPWRHRIALKIGGVDVSWCAIVDFRQQIGTATVRMGGLADVNTHSEHRFKGYSRIVLLNMLRWLRRSGYDTTMLYGIGGFYPKFGYAEAFPNVSHSILVRDAERAPAGPCRFVDYDETEHMSSLVAIYHANNAGRTGPTRRDPGMWNRFRKGADWGPRPVLKVALDSRGRPAAYFAIDGAQNAEGTVLEVGCRSPEFFGPLLRELAAWAWAGRIERFRLLLPEDHAFVRYCRQFGTVREMSFRRDGGAMVRLLNVPSALKAIAPVLAGRLRVAAVVKTGSLTIRTNLDDVGLAWRCGGAGAAKVEVGPAKKGGESVRLPQWALAQLLYGYEDVDTLVASGKLSGTKKGLAALSALFPPTPQFHYRVDTF